MVSASAKLLCEMGLTAFRGRGTGGRSDAVSCPNQPSESNIKSIVCLLQMFTGSLAGIHINRIVNKAAKKNRLIHACIWGKEKKKWRSTLSLRMVDRRWPGMLGKWKCEFNHSLERQPTLHFKSIFPSFEFVLQNFDTASFIRSADIHLTHRMRWRSKCRGIHSKYIFNFLNFHSICLMSYELWVMSDDQWQIVPACNCKERNRFIWIRNGVEQKCRCRLGTVDMNGVGDETMRRLILSWVIIHELCANEASFFAVIRNSSFHFYNDFPTIPLRFQILRNESMLFGAVTHSVPTLLGLCPSIRIRFVAV